MQISEIVKVNETRQVGLLPESSTQISLSDPESEFNLIGHS